MHRRSLIKLLSVTGIGAILLSGCFTGARPTLIPQETAPVIPDIAIQDVATILASNPATTFTINYDVVTKFGNIQSAASLAYDPAFGTSITIGEVRYIYSVNGTTLTCSTLAADCTPGIDESRVSDRQLVSTVFKKAAIERMTQDARVAIGSAVASQETIADNVAKCVAIPVVDSNGATQSKNYCAFTNLGVIASMNTADLAVTATSFSVTTTADQFSA